MRVEQVLEGWTEDTRVVAVHDNCYARLVGFYKGNLVLAKYSTKPKGPLRKVRKTARCSTQDVLRQLKYRLPGSEVKAFLVHWKEWFSGKGAMASEQEIVRVENLEGYFLRFYIGGD